VVDRVLFIIPAFNEAASVAAVVSDLRAHYPSADTVVIDDGSTDGTAAAATMAGGGVLRLPVNLGIGAAVQTGLLFAARHGYDVAVQVDGDGQHLASEVEVLLNALRSGACDAVIGSRYLDRKYSGSWPRRIGNSVLSRANSLILGKRITDATSGFRAYNRRAIAFLATTYADDYPEPEAILALARNGLQIEEVSVAMRPRESGRSSITTPRAIYYMLKVLLAMSVSAARERKIPMPREGEDESTNPVNRDPR
jgi:glycosyltransferase involved in cell wall biosynthesis